MKITKLAALAGLTAALGLGLGACGSNSATTHSTPATHSAPTALTTQQTRTICDVVGALVGAGNPDPHGSAAILVSAGHIPKSVSSLPGNASVPAMSIEQATTEVNNAC